jgi:hypothetical protein
MLIFLEVIMDFKALRDLSSSPLSIGSILKLKEDFDHKPDGIYGGLINLGWDVLDGCITPSSVQSRFVRIMNLVFLAIYLEVLTGPPTWDVCRRR